VWPRAAALRGAPVSVLASDAQAPQPPGAPPLACLLDGVPSADAAPSGDDGTAWRCALLPRRFGFAALSLATVRFSPAAAAPPAPLLVLPPPVARAAHPAAPIAPGGAVLWLSGAELAPPPGFGLRAACAYDGVAAAPAHVISSVLVACEAPAATRAGATQTLAIMLQEEVDLGALPSPPAAASSGGAPLALARPAAPVLLSASPVAVLPAGGGALVTLRGTALSEADSPLLACAFGTIAPVAPAWRAGGAGLACVSPARDAAAPPAALTLWLPGGWRGVELPLPLQYYADDVAGDDLADMPASAGLLTLAGPPASLRPPPGAGGAECRFLGAGGGAMPAWPWSDGVAIAAGSAVAAALRCAPPAWEGAPRFVAVALSWLPATGPPPPPLPAPPGALTAAELAAVAAPPPRPLRGVQFDFRAPPTLLRTFPSSAPAAGGGALVTLAGRGFDPGAVDLRCAFRHATAASAASTAEGLGFEGVAFGAAFAHSSALITCEAPAPPAGARLGGAGGTEVTLAGATALPFDFAEAPTALASQPRVGITAGGTHVLLRGAAFLGADVTTQCQACTPFCALCFGAEAGALTRAACLLLRAQFGTVRVAAVVHNATTLS